MSATGEFFTTSESGGIVRYPHLFAVPKAILVGFGRAQALQYVCGRWGESSSRQSLAPWCVLRVQGKG